MAGPIEDVARALCAEALGKLPHDPEVEAGWSEYKTEAILVMGGKGCTANEPASPVSDEVFERIAPTPSGKT